MGDGEFGLGKTRTFEIFETLLAACPDAQVVAVAGKNEKMKFTFEEIVKNHQATNRVKVLGFTNQVPELMNLADLVVTKPGGMTTTESLACNLPMLIINPIPGQEEENAEFLENNGIAVWLKKKDNVSKVIANLFSDPDLLNKMKENTKLLSHPYSTQEICEILLK